MGYSGVVGGSRRFEVAKGSQCELLHFCYDVIVT